MYGPDQVSALCASGCHALLFGSPVHPPTPPPKVTHDLPDKRRQEYLARLTTYDPVRARASSLAITKQLAAAPAQSSLTALLRKSRPQALVHKKQHEIEKKILYVWGPSARTHRMSH